MFRQRKAILINCLQDDHPQTWAALAGCGVEIEAEFPDARTAIDTVRLSQNEDRLCLMVVTTPDQVRQLAWLSKCFVGRPVLAFVGEGCPPELVYAVNRAGAAQVVPLPVDVEDLRAALHTVGLRHAAQQPVAARRVIAVSGVTGGCGATTIAINLADEIAHRYKLSCVLTELTSLGMIATCLDVEAQRTTHDLLRDIHSVELPIVEKSLCRSGDRPAAEPVGIF
jgi:pilus assembly protein CpaE